MSLFLNIVGFESGTEVLHNTSDSNSEEPMTAGFGVVLGVILCCCQVLQIMYAYVFPTSTREYSLPLLIVLLLVSMALFQITFEMDAKLIAHIPGTDTVKNETLHSEILTDAVTDAADHSSTSTTTTTTTTTTVITTNIAKTATAAALTIPTATLLAVPSSNVHASKCTHQNNVYASLSADEDVLEVVGSDNNL